MEEARKSHDNSFLTGLVLGGVIGAALALIFGKDEDDQLKKTLVKKGKTVLRNLGEIIEDERADLKLHWGGEEGEKAEKEEKEDEEGETSSTVKKVARFFHKSGRRLG